MKPKERIQSVDTAHHSVHEQTHLVAEVMHVLLHAGLHESQVRGDDLLIRQGDR